MKQFDELVEIMARLRSPDGCPWDREQDHQTLKPYMIEEAYEAVEAVDSGDSEKLCAELGDVLLQVVFHARVAEEVGSFDIRAVCDRINQKLIYRHPHVFGDTEVAGSDEVLHNWERLKRAEKESASRESVLDGIPGALPALKRAADMQKKASKVGFDWPDLDGPLQKVDEELTELHEARAMGDQSAIADELGDVLFALVNVARFLKVDAEDALRMACDRFAARFRSVEQQAREMGKDLSDMSLAEMDVLWERSKAE
jgi:tetrapyrrole methylase family protein/MazG family protein